MNRPFNLRVCPGGSLPGGCGCGTPAPIVCPPVTASRGIESQTIVSLPQKLTLTGGDIFFTGPAQVSVSFSVNFHTVPSPCPGTLTFVLLLDGNPISPPVSAAASSGTANGGASFSVDSSVHSIGLEVFQAAECVVTIDGGSVALTANCINPRIPPTIIGA